MRTPLIIIARMAFAIPFLILGIMHFMYAKGMTAGVPAYIPGGVIWIYITGIGLIAASVSFLLNIYTKWAGICLAGMLVIFIFTIHVPGLASKVPMTVKWSSVALFKDFALAAGALLIAGIGMFKRK